MDENNYPSNLFQSYGPTGEIYNKNNIKQGEDHNENISLDDIIMEDEDKDEGFYKKHNIESNFDQNINSKLHPLFR